MKEVTMFVKSGCPFCDEADAYISQLAAEDDRYKNIKIKVIDEDVEVDLANSFDYYFVPTFYVDGSKLHEGIPSKDAVKATLDAALS